jgi:ligand-binding sensor domain-containing protein
MKYVYSFLLLSCFITYGKGQNKTDLLKDTIKSKDVSTSYGPNSVVFSIKQDRKGNIWIVSREGIFRYNGKSFTNITSKVSSARFFSVLEDRKGNFWFGSTGSGVYYYDGISFQNFTTREGLLNNAVSNIYEDKTGNIWFGTTDGASRYDGKSFRNFKMKEGASPYNNDSVHVSMYRQPLPEVHWMHNDVKSIIEDKTGKLWFGTSGYASVYDGTTFTTITNKDAKPFQNIRSIIKDKKGNIWLGGNDSLWRYNGSTFTNFTQEFADYIYKDRKGNIKSLSDKKPIVAEIKSKGRIFGILEANDGSIWVGTPNGVYRYNGKRFEDFKGKEGQK